jgi:hypothetical protein
MYSKAKFIIPVCELKMETFIVTVGIIVNGYCDGGSGCGCGDSSCDYGGCF